MKTKRSVMIICLWYDCSISEWALCDWTRLQKLIKFIQLMSYADLDYLEDSNSILLFQRNQVLASLKFTYKQLNYRGAKITSSTNTLQWLSTQSNYIFKTVCPFYVMSHLHTQKKKYMQIYWLIQYFINCINILHFKLKNTQQKKESKWKLNKICVHNYF